MKKAITNDNYAHQETVRSVVIDVRTSAYWMWVRSHCFLSYFTIALGIKKQKKKKVHVSFFYFSHVFHITINSILQTHINETEGNWSYPEEQESAYQWEGQRIPCSIYFWQEEWLQCPCATFLTNFFLQGTLINVCCWQGNSCQPSWLLYCHNAASPRADGLNWTQVQRECSLHQFSVDRWQTYLLCCNTFVFRLHLLLPVNPIKIRGNFHSFSARHCSTI